MGAKESCMIFHRTISQSCIRLLKIVTCSGKNINEVELKLNLCVMWLSVTYFVTLEEKTSSYQSPICFRSVTLIVCLLAVGILCSLVRRLFRNISLVLIWSF